jgi:hypothetical protein
MRSGLTPPHSLLPPEAIQALQQAAQTPITADDPRARVKAIEKVTERVKRDYPHLFKEYHHES